MTVGSRPLSGHPPSLQCLAGKRNETRLGLSRGGVRSDLIEIKSHDLALVLFGCASGERKREQTKVYDSEHPTPSLFGEPVQWTTVRSSRNLETSG